MSALAPNVFPTPKPSDRIEKDWVPVLKKVPLFGGIPNRQLRKIPARVRRFGAEERIVRAGDPGNAFYVILDGEVRVRPSSRHEVVLTIGDYFGEMALLDGAPRSADISAVGEVTTMVIGRAAFAKLLRSEPQMAAMLLRTLARRLRAAQEQY